MDATFERRHGIVDVDIELAQALVPQARVLAVELLPGGFCNSNYRVTLDGPPYAVVLRLMSHDSSRWRRQVNLMRRVRERVRVPALLAAGVDERLAVPYAVLEWVDGARLDGVLDHGGQDLRSLGLSVGRELARIGSFGFDATGFLDDDLKIERPLGRMSGALWSYYRETALEGRARLRLGALAEPLTTLVETNLHYIDALRDTQALVHADFNGKNILVRRDAPEVAAVLDWDFAFSGPPLADLGNLTRHPLPAAFETGVLDGFVSEGGHLPPWWRRAARLLDLLAQCEFLDSEEERPRRFADATALLRRTIDEWEILPQ